MQKGVYTEVDTEKFLKKYVPVAKHFLASTLTEAEVAAAKLGFPLVLKIISPDALHKSEIHGVRLVKTRMDFVHEYHELVHIAQKKKLRLDGILVQEYLHGKYVIIGLKKDPVFGHILAFGIGGIYTELLKDVAFRVCPITEKDADEMIQELKMRALLFPYRGSHGVHIPTLKKVLVQVSRIPMKNAEIQEMDINPFVINEKSGAVVDARMVV